MAYCILSDVEGRLRGPALSSESTPTVSEAESMITGIGAEIDMALDIHNVATPVTTPARFVLWLKELNTVGAAASALMTRKADASGLNADAAASRLEKRYQDGLALLRSGAAIPTELRTDTTNLPTALHIERPDEEPFAVGDLRRNPFDSAFAL